MNREIMHPDVAQLVLISIYQEVPDTKMVTARMQSAKPEDDILRYPEMEQQLRFLKGLLQDAQITDSAKRVIYYDFETSFMFGLVDYSDVFKIIGMMDGPRTNQGIFSSDINQRMEIERDLYKFFLDSREAALKDDEDLEYYDGIINGLTNDFEQLYSGPIATSQVPIS